VGWFEGVAKLFVVHGFTEGAMQPASLPQVAAAVIHRLERRNRLLVFAVGKELHPASQSARSRSRVGATAW